MRSYIIQQINSNLSYQRIDLVSKLALLIFLCLSPINLVAGELLDLYKKTLEINPTLLSRGYSIDQSQAREDQAFSSLLPQITLDGTYSYNRFHSQGQVTNYYDSTRGSAQLSQVLFDLPSYLRYRSAESETLQAKLEKDVYVMQLGGDLIDIYLLVHEASKNILYLKQEKISVQSQIKRLRKMLKRQMTTVTDLYSVEAYEQDLNTQIIEADNEKNIALERIREISSILPEHLSSLEINKIPDVPVAVEKKVEESINSNPLISALREGLKAAEKNISAATSEHLPSVSLQFTQTYSDQGFDNRQSPPFDVGVASVQLSIPIFSGGRINAEIREAVAARNIIFQEIERSKNEIEREIRSIFLNVLAGRARIDSTQRQLDARIKATKALEKGHELGVYTIVDVLESKRSLMESQTGLWQARYQYLRSIVLLKVWTGTLTMASMEEIDQWFSTH